MAGPIEVTTDRLAPTDVYSASRIFLYGVPFENGAECTVGPSGVKIGLGCSAEPFQPWQMALIYGYAYQGHVYSLPEPVIMLVNMDPNSEAGGEGGFGSDYTRWEADKLDRSAQLVLTNDTFEELLLKKNVGESRQPVSYHAAMTMSHRGGKLMD